MTAAERVIATARAQVGYIGKRTRDRLDEPGANPGGLYNKYARDMDDLGDWYNGKKQGYDWCDVGVDWCFVRAFGRELAERLLCNPRHGLGAGVKYSARYFDRAGRLFYGDPRPGDQVFFTAVSGGKTTWNHTELVTAVMGGSFDTVGFNASGTIDGVRHKSCVVERRYPLSTPGVYFGRPDYSLVPAEAEKEETEMEVYETIDDVPDSYRASIQKLVDKGALKGTGGGELNVSEDYCRIMTTLDRLGLLG